MKSYFKLTLAIAAILALAIAFIAPHEALSLPTGKIAANSTATFSRFHLKIGVAKGAAANASIAYTGIKTSDVLLFAIFNDTVVATADWANVSDSTYIQANDSIRCGTATATGYLWIFYNQVN